MHSGGMSYGATAELEGENWKDVVKMFDRDITDMLKDRMIRKKQRKWIIF